MNECVTLPSAESGAELARGELRSLPKAAIHTAGRAGLIALGLLAVGRREHVVRDALAGALAIEAFVVLYMRAKT